MTVRNIIDFAQADQASEMRDALYAAIYDKVHDHIEQKKQEIAHNLVGQQETKVTEEEVQYENFMELEEQEKQQLWSELNQEAKDTIKNIAHYHQSVLEVMEPIFEELDADGKKRLRKVMDSNAASTGYKHAFHGGSGGKAGPKNLGSFKGTKHEAKYLEGHALGTEHKKANTKLQKSIWPEDYKKK